jgi:hypothetical protein
MSVPRPFSSECQLCDDVPPVSYCDECRMFFCEECQRDYHKQSHRKTHSAILLADVDKPAASTASTTTTSASPSTSASAVNPPSSSSTAVPPCELCDDQPSTIKCDQCDMTYCSECDIGLHRPAKMAGHKRHPIGAESKSAESTIPVSSASATSDEPSKFNKPSIKLSSSEAHESKEGIPTPKASVAGGKRPVSPSPVVPSSNSIGSSSTKPSSVSEEVEIEESYDDDGFDEDDDSAPGAKDKKKQLDESVEISDDELPGAPKLNAASTATKPAANVKSGNNSPGAPLSSSNEKQRAPSTPELNLSGGKVGEESFSKAAPASAQSPSPSLPVALDSELKNKEVESTSTLQRKKESEGDDDAVPSKQSNEEEKKEAERSNKRSSSKSDLSPPPAFIVPPRQRQVARHSAAPGPASADDDPFATPRPPNDSSSSLASPPSAALSAASPAAAPASHRALTPRGEDDPFGSDNESSPAKPSAASASAAAAAASSRPATTALSILKGEESDTDALSPRQRTSSNDFSSVTAKRKDSLSVPAPKKPSAASEDEDDPFASPRPPADPDAPPTSSRATAASSAKPSSLSAASSAFSSRSVDVDDGTPRFVRFSMTHDYASPPGGRLPMFQKLLLADLTKSLASFLSVSQLKIVQLRSGSIVADVRIAAPGAAKAASELIKQANDSESALLRGKVTDKTVLGSARLIDESEANAPNDSSSAISSSTTSAAASPTVNPVDEPAESISAPSAPSPSSSPSDDPFASPRNDVSSKPVADAAARKKQKESPDISPGSLAILVSKPVDEDDPFGSPTLPPARTPAAPASASVMSADASATTSSIGSAAPTPRPSATADNPEHEAEEEDPFSSPKPTSMSAANTVPAIPSPPASPPASAPSSARSFPPSPNPIDTKSDENNDDGDDPFGSASPDTKPAAAPAEAVAAAATPQPSSARSVAADDEDPFSSSRPSGPEIPPASPALSTRSSDDLFGDDAAAPIKPGRPSAEPIVPSGFPEIPPSPLPTSARSDAGGDDPFASKPPSKPTTPRSPSLLSEAGSSRAPVSKPSSLDDDPFGSAASTPRHFDDDQPLLDMSGDDVFGEGSVVHDAEPAPLVMKVPTLNIKDFMPPRKEQPLPYRTVNDRCAMCLLDDATRFCVDCNMALCESRGCDRELHAGDLDFHERRAYDEFKHKLPIKVGMKFNKLGDDDDELFDASKGDSSMPVIRKKDAGAGKLPKFDKNTTCHACKEPATVYCFDCKLFLCSTGCDAELHARSSKRMTGDSARGGASQVHHRRLLKDDSRIGGDIDLDSSRSSQPSVREPVYSNSRLCEVCRDSDAVRRCGACSMNFCRSCDSDWHRDEPLFREHQREPMIPGGNDNDTVRRRQEQTRSADSKRSNKGSGSDSDDASNASDDTELDVMLKKRSSVSGLRHSRPQPSTESEEDESVPTPADEESAATSKVGSVASTPAVSARQPASTRPRSPDIPSDPLSVTDALCSECGDVADVWCPQCRKYFCCHPANDMVSQKKKLTTGASDSAPRGSRPPSDDASDVDADTSHTQPDPLGLLDTSVHNNCDLHVHSLAAKRSHVRQSLPHHSQAILDMHEYVSEQRMANKEKLDERMRQRAEEKKRADAERAEQKTARQESARRKEKKSKNRTAGIANDLDQAAMQRESELRSRGDEEHESYMRKARAHIKASEAERAMEERREADRLAEKEAALEKRYTEAERAAAEERKSSRDSLIDAARLSKFQLETEWRARIAAEREKVLLEVEQAKRSDAYKAAAAEARLDRLAAQARRLGVGEAVHAVLSSKQARTKAEENKIRAEAEKKSAEVALKERRALKEKERESVLDGLVKAREERREARIAEMEARERVEAKEAAARKKMRETVRKEQAIKAERDAAKGPQGDKFLPIGSKSGSEAQARIAKLAAQREKRESARLEKTKLSKKDKALKEGLKAKERMEKSVISESDEDATEEKTARKPAKVSSVTASDASDSDDIFGSAKKKSPTTDAASCRSTSTAMTVSSSSSDESDDDLFSDKPAKMKVPVRSTSSIRSSGAPPPTPAVPSAVDSKEKQKPKISSVDSDEDVSSAPSTNRSVKKKPVNVKENAAPRSPRFPTSTAPKRSVLKEAEHTKAWGAGKRKELLGRTLPKPSDLALQTAKEKEAESAELARKQAEKERKAADRKERLKDLTGGTGKAEAALAAATGKVKKSATSSSITKDDSKLIPTKDAEGSVEDEDTAVPVSYTAKKAAAVRSSGAPVENTPASSAVKTDSKKESAKAIEESKVFDSDVEGEESSAALLEDESNNSVDLDESIASDEQTDTDPFDSPKPAAKAKTVESNAPVLEVNKKSVSSITPIRDHVNVRFTMQHDYSSPPGKKLSMFEKLLIADVSKALMLPEKQIRVLSMRSGSIIAELRFNGPAATMAAKEFLRQANNENSALLRGKVTDKTVLGSAELIDDEQVHINSGINNSSARMDEPKGTVSKSDKSPFDTTDYDDEKSVPLEQTGNFIVKQVEKKQKHSPSTSADSTSLSFEEEEKVASDSDDERNKSGNSKSSTQSSVVIKMGESMLPDKRSLAARTLGRDAMLSATLSGKFGETLKPALTAAAERAATNAVQLDDEDLEGEDESSMEGGSLGKFGATMRQPLTTTYKDFSFVRAAASVNEDNESVMGSARSSAPSENSSARSPKHKDASNKPTEDDGEVSEDLDASVELPSQRSTSRGEDAASLKVSTSKVHRPTPPALPLSPSSKRPTRARDANPVRKGSEDHSEPHNITPPESLRTGLASTAPHHTSKHPASKESRELTTSHTAGGLRKWKANVVPAEALGHQRVKKSVPIADDEFTEEEAAKLWPALADANKPVPAQKWAKHQGAPGRIQSPPPMAASHAIGGSKPSNNAGGPTGAAAGARPTSANIHASAAAAAEKHASIGDASDEFDDTTWKAMKSLANFKEATRKGYAIKGQEVSLSFHKHRDAEIEKQQQLLASKLGKKTDPSSTGGLASPSKSKLRAAASLVRPGTAGSAASAVAAFKTGGAKSPSRTSARPDSARSVASSVSTTASSSSTGHSSRSVRTGSQAWGQQDEHKEQQPISASEELDENHPAVQAAAQRLLAKALAAAAQSGDLAATLIEQVGSPAQTPKAASVTASATFVKPPVRAVSKPRGGLAPALTSGADSARSIGSNMTIHSESSEFAVQNVLAKPTRIAPPSTEEVPIVTLPPRKIITSDELTGAHPASASKSGPFAAIPTSISGSVRPTPSPSPLTATTPLRSPSASSSAAALALSRYPPPSPSSAISAPSSTIPVAAPLSPLKDPNHVQSMMKVIEAEVAALRAAAATYEARRTHPSATLTFNPAPLDTRGAPLPLQTNLAMDAALPNSQYHPHVSPIKFATPNVAAAAAHRSVSGSLPSNPRTSLLTHTPILTTLGTGALPVGTLPGTQIAQPNKAPAAQLDAHSAYSQQLRRREITKP